MVRKLLAGYNERVRGRPDSEHSQAILRIGIVGVLLVYTSWVAGHDPGGAAGLWATNLVSALFSVVLVARILQNPGASPRRRVIGAVHDNLAITVWLHQAGPMGALYLFVYPFVTVGNGFRFGVQYLAWSGVLGAAGIGVLVVSAPAWHTHQLIGTGVFLSHVLVTVYIGVLLTRMRRMQDQLQKMASYDILTGLPNRRLFMDQVSRLLTSRHRENMACLYLDLDGFKLVNDRHGHEVGDQLLTLVAQKVTGCVRPSDMPARLGGDEFAVVLDRLTSPHDARTVATRIIETLESVVEVGGHAVVVSTSIGIAYLRAGETSLPPAAEALVKAADEAMYRAKKAGKGQYKLVDVHAELDAAMGVASIDGNSETVGTLTHSAPPRKLGEGRCASTKRAAVTI